MNKKYLYTPCKGLSGVYKCQGELGKVLVNPGMDQIVTSGYKGDRINADQSIYLDPAAPNVLTVLDGEHKGKALVIIDESPTHYFGVEFLNHFGGSTAAVPVSKLSFQEAG